MSGSKSVLENFGIAEKRYIILATPGNNSKLSKWNIITDKGPLTFVGLNMDAYIDKEIKVLEKGGDIIAVLTVESEAPTIMNAYIVSADNNRVTIFSGGAERTYIYNGLNERSAGEICDISISGENALDIKLFEEKISDLVMCTSLTSFEFKSKGDVQVGDNFKIYSIADGNVKWKQLSNLVVGTDLAEYALKDGKICAAIIKERPAFKNIRVAISDTGFKGLYHEKVSITGSKGVTLKYGDKSKIYKPGEEIIIDDEFFTEVKRIYIIPDTDGIITINNIKRNWSNGESPQYGGSFEVRKTDEGYTIVNIVDVEKYLYTVVPSEMPTSHGVEALKIQAITARSYAYNQFYANRYHKYGANVDDSVSCQVYNNIPANEASTQAVNLTKGMYLSYKGEVVSANFFSTSSGMTANSGEVWANGVTKQFPSAGSAYLKAEKQYEGVDFGDLHREENASRFFEETEIDSYDSKYSWFRWKTEMTAKEITASINANITARYNANPQLIKTMQDGNVFRSKPIESIGELVDMEILSRGEGGNIMSMKITGTEATIMVMTEYNIRALIRPYQYISGGRKIPTIVLDGSEVSNYSIMPSAFFVFEKTKTDEGALVNVSFFGGGNGHGVGMSQNGVKGMVDKGFKYEEILMHYYKGTEIVKK